MKQTARIENWRWFGLSLAGNIFDHPRQEDFAGLIQATSVVLSIDLENNRAETLNTIYELGAPYVHS